MKKALMIILITLFMVFITSVIFASETLYITASTINMLGDDDVDATLYIQIEDNITGKIYAYKESFLKITDLRIELNIEQTLYMSIESSDFAYTSIELSSETTTISALGIGTVIVSFDLINKLSDDTKKMFDRIYKDIKSKLIEE